jgi:hypothetical protein
MEELKYPIGNFIAPVKYTNEFISIWINDLELFPSHLSKLVYPLTKEQLLLTYRPEGWSIAQVVHHCADSHLNSFIRFKLSLTENEPIIRPYFEDRWAELPDGMSLDVTDSLIIIKGLHAKWVSLLKSLTTEDLGRVFIHPEHNTKVTLAENVGIYAWHCNHHLAHVEMGLKAN